MSGGRHAEAEEAEPSFVLSFLRRRRAISKRWGGREKRDGASGGGQRYLGTQDAGLSRGSALRPAVGECISGQSIGRLSQILCSSAFSDLWGQLSLCGEKGIYSAASWLMGLCWEHVHPRAAITPCFLLVRRSECVFKTTRVRARDINAFASACNGALLALEIDINNKFNISNNFFKQIYHISSWKKEKRQPRCLGFLLLCSLCCHWAGSICSIKRACQSL